MSLETFWFIVVAFFWTGFFVLEGFDFGVGVLHTIVGRDDRERRTALKAIGPFWDGNEVWLIVAGAGTFAAFPDWYATWFSALYLALMLVLVGAARRRRSLLGAQVPAGVAEHEDALDDGQDPVQQDEDRQADPDRRARHRR